MKIRKFTLNFIKLGKDKKIYLRYYITNNHKGESLNIPCDLSITDEQLQKLNAGTLGGMIQENCFKIRNEYLLIIRMLSAQNNSFPTPDEIREYKNVTNAQLSIEYYINQYLHSLTDKVKPATKMIYAGILRKFKKYFEENLSNHSIAEIINMEIIENFGINIIAYKKIKKQKITAITVFNQKSIVLFFLNYIAKDLKLKQIDNYLVAPKTGEKYHISEVDVDRLLKYVSAKDFENEVLNIIRVNKHCGLRINELLKIEKANVTIEKDCVFIRFDSQKGSKEREIAIVDKIAMDIIKKHLLLNFNATNNNYLWQFNSYNYFNTVLKAIAKEVFKEETVKIHKITGYIEFKKCEVISSHCFRRFAAERLVNDFGIEVARTFTGHADSRTLTKHYSGWTNREDLRRKLLNK